MSPTADRRQFWRATFAAPVRLTTDSESVEAQLEDISLKGALIEVPYGWRGRIGEPCHIKLSLAQGEAIIMWTKVAHVEGRFVGLRCENIDLDSITHLRRLVELNSGDPALLERELQALLAP